jgi:Ca2+-binding EF-hand superfamily protein
MFIKHTDGDLNKPLPAAALPDLLNELGYKVPDDSTDKSMPFPEFVKLVDKSRSEKTRQQRLHAGFTEQEVERIRRVFSNYDVNKDGTIYPTDVSRILSQMGFKMGGKEEKDKVLGYVDDARKAAAFVGVENVGTPRTGKVNLWVLLQLLRVVYKRDDRRVLDKEARAMEATRFSKAEVDVFREVFQNWCLKEQRFEDEDSKSKAQQYTRMVVAGGETKELSKEGVRRLLRSMGLKLDNADRRALEGKIDTLDTGGRVDFADFLNLMRWMVDSNFAGIEANS